MILLILQSIFLLTSCPVDGGGRGVELMDRRVDGDDADDDELITVKTLTVCTHTHTHVRMMITGDGGGGRRRAGFFANFANG